MATGKVAKSSDRFLEFTGLCFYLGRPPFDAYSIIRITLEKLEDWTKDG